MLNLIKKLEKDDLEIVEKFLKKYSWFIYPLIDQNIVFYLDEKSKTVWCHWKNGWGENILN